MVLMLDEDESFSMTANVTSTGPQSMALKGFLVKKTSNGTYIASLLPQMFYGADGLPLTSWRQNLTATGSQVILSRAAGGYPEVPKEEIYWRKVSDSEEAVSPAPTAVPTLEIPSWVLPLGALIAGGLIVYLLIRK